MMRVLMAAAPVSLVLGVTRLLPAPYDIAILGVAAFLLYRLVRELAGSGAARVSVTLLLASLAPTLSAAAPPPDISLPALATLSLLWWMPLIIGGLAVARLDRAADPTWVLLFAWWALTAALALTGAAPWAAIAARVETAAAAALAGVAVAHLAEAALGAARRRPLLIASLTVTCVWQAWLALGTGRPARVLVPMLVAGLMIAATDLLTDEPRDERDSVGAAIVIAMLVLGLVPGAHTMVAQQQATATVQAPPAALVPGAEAPSSVAAP